MTCDQFTRPVPIQSSVRDNTVSQLVFRAQPTTIDYTKTTYTAADSNILGKQRASVLPIIRTASANQNVTINILREKPKQWPPCLPQMLRPSDIARDWWSSNPPRAHRHVVGMLRFMSDVNQPSLATPFYSFLVSISVFMALSTVFHFINSHDNSSFSHSVLPVLSLPYWSFIQDISL